MRFYMAPMEGVTGYIYRNAYQSCFGQIDKYFAPFIVASSHRTMSAKERNDILPENNKSIFLVPQILTNKSDDFIATAKWMQEFGYQEINLNLGCPSGTVTAKGKGAGFLARTDELDSFLNTIFEKVPMKISIKTRIGKTDPDEWGELMEIYNRYPISELIIHPRIQTDFYGNQPNWTVFREALKESKNPVCYNGDIFTVEDYKKIQEEFPKVECVMLGRGLIKDPFLLNRIRNHGEMDQARLKDFHEQIYKAYQEMLFGDRNILFKMKEIWSYMIALFPEEGKAWKQIRKAQHLTEYEAAVATIFHL